MYYYCCNSLLFCFVLFLHTIQISDIVEIAPKFFQIPERPTSKNAIF